MTQETQLSGLDAQQIKESTRTSRRKHQGLSEGLWSLCILTISDGRQAGARRAGLMKL